MTLFLSFSVSLSLSLYIYIYVASTYTYIHTQQTQKQMSDTVQGLVFIAQYVLHATQDTVQAMESALESAHVQVF